VGPARDSGAKAALLGDWPPQNKEDSIPSAKSGVVGRNEGAQEKPRSSD